MHNQHAYSTRPPRRTADRRTLLRLRDLCDEVLASYRVAHERDVIPAADRAEAAQLLAQVTPFVPKPAA